MRHQFFIVTMALLVGFGLAAHLLSQGSYHFACKPKRRVRGSKVVDGW